MRRAGEMSLTHTLAQPGSRPELLWRLETPVGLATIFALGFVIRIALAPRFGFHGDLRLFQVWTGELASAGTHHFYAQGGVQDYPPADLYVLWLTSKISATPGYILLKLPTILADLALAWIAGTLAVRIASRSLNERWPVRALVAAGVLFNPAVLAVGAVWGQTDAVPAAFVLGSLLLLFTGPQSLRREVAAFLLFAVAASMKPQSSFVLPVMLYALYRRYLHGRSRPALLDGALGIAAACLPAVVVWGVSGLPFGLGPIALFRFYRHWGSFYPVTSANAFNFWGAIAFWRNDSTGDNVLHIAGISALHFGYLIVVAGIVYVMWRAHRAIERGANEALALTVASATISLLAFTFLTRMHERYMFLALATLAPLVVLRSFRYAYAILSALFVINLWYPYAYFNSQWHVEDLHFQPLFGWIFGDFTNDTWQKKVWSVAVTLVTLGVAWLSFRWSELSTGLEQRPMSTARTTPVSGLNRLRP